MQIQADSLPLATDLRRYHRKTYTMSTDKETYNILHEIYQKHRRNYRENADSKQMCCMWSTNNPPDQIVETEPFNDIEAAFDIVIDEDDAMDLYDMFLKDAAKRIMQIQESK